jgi:hypothetical protein
MGGTFSAFLPLAQHNWLNLTNPVTAMPYFYWLDSDPWGY